MRDQHLFAVYICAITLAEAVTVVDAICGLLTHASILLSLIALSVREGRPSALYSSLCLAPLIRMISLSLPLARLPRPAWHVASGLGVMLAALTLMRIQGFGFRRAGVRLERPLLQAVIGFTGIPLGVIEYRILRPAPLVQNPSLHELVLLGLATVIFTGFVEELVFRGIIQRNVVEVLGAGYGVLGTDAIFTALHIGWLSPLDLIFVFLVGLFYGISALTTRSIVGTSISHGVSNVMLFLVIPALR